MANGSEVIQAPRRECLWWFATTKIETERMKIGKNGRRDGKRARGWKTGEGMEILRAKLKDDEENKKETMFRVGTKAGISSRLCERFAMKRVGSSTLHYGQFTAHTLRNRCLLLLSHFWRFSSSKTYCEYVCLLTICDSGSKTAEKFTYVILRLVLNRSYRD